ncbi:MAG: NYN domain-containing protein [Leptolyngbya sp. SIO1D8]|nr:NYN domain-containing protein [Leptolyngbya sp. SIO1D8]
MKSSSDLALLLVDGYNVIGAWPQLTQLRDHESLESARHHLVEALTNYSAYKGFKTRVVFDAYAQETPGLKEAVTEDVSIHYTDFGQTADTCIEKWCAQLRHQIRFSDQRLIVATSDQAQRLTVTGYGAEWMSAQRLASEVSAAVRQRQKSHRSKGFNSKAQRLSSGLKPEVQDRLKSLRTKLEQQSRLSS